MQRVCTVHRYTMSKQSGRRVRPGRRREEDAASVYGTPVHYEQTVRTPCQAREEEGGGCSECVRYTGTL